MKINFSIITVCYNAEDKIAKTVNSVLAQVENDYEYIIVDGSSKDNTLNICKGFEESFKRKNIPFYIISEKDKGIYDAMNKGIKLASGKWINFMNAGDCFYSKKVLKEIINKESDIKEKVLIYGYKYQNNKPLYPLNLSVLKKGIIMANHQSMFFNLDILKSDLIYKSEYLIYGDYELVNRLYLKFGLEKIKYLNMPIAIYEGQGISEKPSFQKRKDKYRIVLKHYGFFGVFRSLIYRAKSLV